MYLRLPDENVEQWNAIMSKHLMMNWCSHLVAWAKSLCKYMLVRWELCQCDLVQRWCLCGTTRHLCFLNVNFFRNEDPITEAFKIRKHSNIIFNTCTSWIDFTFVLVLKCGKLCFAWSMPSMIRDQGLFGFTLALMLCL